jgi:hypothetical protein
MYDKVRELCASGGMIEFAWKGKTVGRARCTTPLAAPTLGWQIRRNAP